MSVFDEPKVDAHCHILDPAHFPYAADVAYRPAGQEIGPLEQYLQVMDAHGIRHALLVGPNSGYGLDNRCLLDAIARGAGRFRGIAVVRNDIARAELLRLREAGVIGVALNATVQGVDHCAGAGPLMQHCADLGMFVQMQAEDAQWVALQPLLERCEARLLIDHCGRPRAGAGVAQAGFQVVLGLGRSGRAAVKLSGYQKFAELPPPYPDAQAYVQALLDAFTLDACFWASDWPFLRAPQRLDVGPLIRQVERLLPDERDRRKLWWDTPRRWLGIDR